ncbi:hypothetical protein Zm00014a_005201, partial [Zea mays]
STNFAPNYLQYLRRFEFPN